MEPDEPTKLLQCAACGNFAIGDGEIRCCDSRMMEAERTTAAIPEPTLDDLLETVFDMSDAELEICLCVMKSGDLTTPDLAERISYDRSVVSRHLNHLAELGVIDKLRRLLEEGGHTYVYQPVDPETVRKRLTAAFATWVCEATDQLRTLRREKVESIAVTDDEPAWQIFRDVQN